MVKTPFAIEKAGENARLAAGVVTTPDKQRVAGRFVKKYVSC
jgi:hypothetical protein